MLSLPPAVKLSCSTFKGRELQERIGQIVRFLQSQSWTGVLFTAGSQTDQEKVRGSVNGTFSLEFDSHVPS